MLDNIDELKLKQTMEIIDKIADCDNDDEIVRLEKALREITGKEELCAENCFEYWSWTSLEELARTFLMPSPEYQGLSDEKLTEIITKICEAEYSESEMDYQLEVLEKETGLSDVSDYIFYPDEVGLSMESDTSEIVAKILSDRKR